MNAPNDVRPGNGWTQAETWVKRELDRLGNEQEITNTRLDKLTMWMLTQTAGLAVAILLLILGLVTRRTV